MNEDWYEKGRQQIIHDIAEIIGAEPDIELAAISIYTMLVEDGLIDYDIEKDVFYEIYGGVDDED